jgi:hypothetical protein
MATVTCKYPLVVHDAKLMCITEVARAVTNDQSLQPARGLGDDGQVRIATATALFIVLISFSRLYLGVHWFSDVLAGISFGVAWIATAAVLHRVGDENERDASSLGVASFITFAISATVHIIMPRCGHDPLRPQVACLHPLAGRNCLPGEMAKHCCK